MMDAQAFNRTLRLEDLLEAFRQLPPPQKRQTHRCTVNLPLTDSDGQVSEWELLFYWNSQRQQWELNTQLYKLTISCSPL